MDDIESSVSVSQRGKKGARFSKIKKPVPPDRDESFIESTPEHTLIKAGDESAGDFLTDSDYDSVSKKRNISTNDEDDELDTNRTLSEKEELLILGFRLYTNLDIKDRKWKLKTYKSCFLGNECVDWLVENNICLTRSEAIKKGVRLVRAEYMMHVERKHDFEDSPYFYKFINPLHQFRNVSSKYGAVIQSRKQSESTSESKDYLLMTVARKCRNGFKIKDRTYRFKKYKQCFVGEQAVTWMCQNGVAGGRSEAVELGQMMIDKGIIQHVATQGMGFRDGKKFYEFINKNAQKIY